MNAGELYEQLDQNRKRIAALVTGMSAEQATWRPAPETWSALEVVNHLYDEECEDFPVRLNLILRDPAAAWPPIDPKGWVTERRYNARDLAQSVENFLGKRGASLVWLAELLVLDDPDWGATAHTPWGGSMTAGDLLAAWAAHDVLHMRQLVELHWAYVSHLAVPCTTIYAGEW